MVLIGQIDRFNGPTTLNIYTCLPKGLSIKIFFYLLLLLSGFNSVSAQSTLEVQADFNVSKGRLSFPVLLQDDGLLYDICLQLEAGDSSFRFSLQSAAVRSETIPGISTYSQLGGVMLLTLWQSLLDNSRMTGQ